MERLRGSLRALDGNPDGCMRTQSQGQTSLQGAELEGGRRCPIFTRLVSMYLFRFS